MQDEKGIDSQADKPDAACPDNLRTAYQELCSSYRAIDDFRTKLLGFLPLATLTGILLLITDQAKMDFAQRYFRPIGIFGFFITLGLFFYELYGIKKCTYLIWAGTDLEAELHIKHGQFESRPPGVLLLISEPLAAGVIYSAVLAAWAFLALAFPQPYDATRLQPQDAARWWAIGIFLTGFALTCFYNLYLILKGKNRSAK